MFSYNYEYLVMEFYVFYFVASTCGNIFDIGNTSGLIRTNTTNFDRDEGSIEKKHGICIITVEVRLFIYIITILIFNRLFECIYYFIYFL